MTMTTTSDDSIRQTRLFMIFMGSLVFIINDAKREMRRKIMKFN